MFTTLPLRRLASIATALGASALFASAAHAATITVTIPFDRFDSGATTGCSLREAIQTANTNVAFSGCAVSGMLGNDVLVFDSSLTTVTITQTVSGGNNDNTDGDLDAFVGVTSGTLTIRGPITIQVAGIYDRAIDVHPDGSGSGASFTLEGVTITGGDVRPWLTTDNLPHTNAQLACVNGGGAVRVISGVQATLAGVVLRENAAGYAGGGLCAQENASVVITGSQMLSNTVGLSGTQPVDYALGGGGIWSGGALVLTNTDVLTNRVVLSSGFSLADFGFAGGGGVGVITGSLSVSGGVIAHNVVTQTQAGDHEAHGGGVLFIRLGSPASDVLLRGVTIRENRLVGGKESAGAGAAIFSGADVQIIGNTTIVGNAANAGRLVAGGGLAVGWPGSFSGYTPPTITLTGSSVLSSSAEVNATSVFNQITPTVLGAGAFFGEGVVFAVANANVNGNVGRYVGSSVTNTNGVGGGLSALHNGSITNSQFLANQLRNFYFVGGAGAHLKGTSVNVVRMNASDNIGASSLVTAAGSLGGGMFVDSGAEVALSDSLFSSNVVTGERHSGSLSGFAAGGGLGVDGRLFITDTRVVSNTARSGGGFAGAGLVRAKLITVTNNVATDPDWPNEFAQGGAWANSGTVFVENSLIANNVVSRPQDSGQGGAIVNYGGTFHVLSTTIQDNAVLAKWFASGGAAAVTGGAMWITNSQVLSNVSEASSNPAYVGGLNVGTGAALHVTDSEIALNEARGNNGSGGGGIGNNGTAHIARTRIHNNRVVDYTTSQPTGGGAGVSNGGELHIRYSAIYGNVAGYASGVNNYGTPTVHIVNSTVSGNGPSGSTTAQGIVVTGTAYLTHTTVASNTGIGLVNQGTAHFFAVLAAYNAGDCANWSGAAMSQFSLSSDNSCGAFGFTFINADPLLQPLALNGGSTPNHELPIGSPALSKVSACGVVDDQRGVGRPSLCDIGAFERLEAVGLNLSKIGAGSVATAGVPFTYTLVISNAGPDFATNVVVTDTLSGGATFGSVVGSSNPASLTHSLSGTSATFTVSVVPANSVFVITYTVLPPVNGGVFSNTASIVAVDQPNTGGGSTTASGGNATANASADLEISKSAEPAVVQPGGVITYTLVVTNNGPSTAQFVTVTDEISGATLGGVVGTSSGVVYVQSGNALTFTVGTLNAGSVVTMVYTATAPTTIGAVISNTAAVTSATNDGNPGNNAPTGGGTSTVVSQAVLDVSKAQTYTLGVGGRVRHYGLVTYTIAITNSGNVTATNVVLTDTLSVHLSYVSGCSFTTPNVVCSLGDLAPGATTQVTIVAQAVTPGAVITNTAVASAGSAPQASSNTVSAQVEYRVWAPIVRKAS